MSRLFYHVMQDNVGNLLFDVTGTMRLAGSGTLATIYGDEALTVILPNPMTNHPSYGSFKCFLGAGDYDFYLAKSGYTFETLTGVQGHGTMAQQDANAVAITGGSATMATMRVNQTTRGSLQADGGILVTNYTPAGNDPYGILSEINAGTDHWNLLVTGTANNYLAGPLLLARSTIVPGQPSSLTTSFTRTTKHGITLIPSDSDTGTCQPLVFFNVSGVSIGSISTTAAATAYNTASDARLKHAIADLTGELALIQALRPVSFVWNADGEPGVGFLAHEVAALVAGVITGDENAVDEQGAIVPQMIDYSKLVPFLTGAVKSLLERVEALQARVEVLEDAAGV